MILLLVFHPPRFTSLLGEQLGFQPTFLEKNNQISRSSLTALGPALHAGWVWRLGLRHFHTSAAGWREKAPLKGATEKPILGHVKICITVLDHRDYCSRVWLRRRSWNCDGDR